MCSTVTPLAVSSRSIPRRPRISGFTKSSFHAGNLPLTCSQQQEVDRLAAQIPTIRERITAILALAEELKGGTIEAVLAKSDAELGLEFLRGKRTP